MRVGYGCDTHRLVEGRKLILGGVEISNSKGLLGHSDADALVHAVIDALLGAAGMGDIGTLYPDTDEKYRGISSIKLLDDVGKRLYDAGYQIENIDSVIIAQKPKMAPYKKSMEQNIAQSLGIGEDKVNVKAKTNETMGFTGREEGIETRAVALIEKRTNSQFVN